MPAGRHAHLEVLNKSARVLPKGAMVGDHAAALQQEQIIKCLQHASQSFNAATATEQSP